MDRTLPQHLQERLQWLTPPDTTNGPPGEFVLYWMHNALRAHENPALDAAICLARQNGLPLLVYHGLSESYPFASDRHHAFMLQGHRDVQRELGDRGITAAFQLQRQGCRGPYLKSLTRAAAVLVTEEMPIQPISGWMERLVATCDTPIATVDCSCVAPVGLLGGDPMSASEFRSRAQPLYDERVHRDYTEQPVDVAMCELDDLKSRYGLMPISLQDADLSELIGQCRIDHSVAPVADTPGGTRSGYRRWRQFRDHSLQRYQQSRSNPTLRDGASRMSAYLHYGMVSPFRIAREAQALNGSKYLDELLTWREMSFHFCFHHRDSIDSLDAVPDWARRTLEEHLTDKRQNDCSWETLARAKTGRPLWDAAQRSLIKHGELHNNVRMTWGKALLPWLCTPARALQMTLDLNHRYALDGRNPSSYGGVLWCYGQFDRPADEDRPVTGTLPPRDIDEQTRRIDLPRFQQIVDRPIAAKLPRVAVIGAGMGGLAAARTLRDHGLDVTVFDKSRGVGGRAATRRAQSAKDGKTVTFDHGTQYFTARDPRFCRLVNSWIDDGLVQPWLGRIVHLDSQANVQAEKSGTPRYVAIPGMNAVAKHLATELPLHLGTTIVKLAREEGAWSLESAEGESFGPYDVVLCNCPPIQTGALIDGHTELSKTVSSVTMRPCWSMMVCDDSLASIPFEGAFVDDSPIAWMSNHTNKSGRTDRPAWVIHATSDWSEKRLEADRSEIIERLLPEFTSLVGSECLSPHHLTAHRWRYAIPDKPLEQECLFDPVEGIGVCGDWCGGFRVEAAYLSGIALAGTLLRHHTIDRAAAADERPLQQSLFTSADH